MIQRYHLRARCVFDISIHWHPTWTPIRTMPFKLEKYIMPFDVCSDNFGTSWIFRHHLVTVYCAAQTKNAATYLINENMTMISAGPDWVKICNASVPVLIKCIAKLSPTEMIFACGSFQYKSVFQSNPGRPFFIWPQLFLQPSNHPFPGCCVILPLLTNMQKWLAGWTRIFEAISRIPKL